MTYFTAGTRIKKKVKNLETVDKFKSLSEDYESG